MKYSRYIYQYQIMKYCRYISDNGSTSDIGQMMKFSRYKSDDEVLQVYIRYVIFFPDIGLMMKYF